MTKVMYKSEIYDLIEYVPNDDDFSLSNMDAIIRKDGATKQVDDREIIRL